MVTESSTPSIHWTTAIVAGNCRAQYYPRSLMSNNIWNNIREGNVEAVKVALETNSLDVNALDQNGCTPLFMACGARKNRIQTVRLLLKHGSDVNTVSSAAGNSVLHYALVKRPEDISKEGGNCVALISLLLNESKSLALLKNVNKDSPLAFACVNADSAAISYLLECNEGVSTQLHEPNLSGVCPLTVLCNSQAPREWKYKSLLHFIKYLDVEDINYQAPLNGNTALHILVETNCSRGILLLLSAGIDIKLRNVHGLTAIDTARKIVDMIEQSATNPNTEPSRQFNKVEKYEAAECLRILEFAWSPMMDRSEAVMKDLIMEEERNSGKKVDNSSDKATKKKKGKKKKKKKKKSNVALMPHEDKVDANGVGVPVQNEKVRDDSSAVSEGPIKVLPNGGEVQAPVKVENKWKDPHNKIVAIIQGSDTALKNNQMSNTSGNVLRGPSAQKSDEFTAAEYMKQFRKSCPLSETLDISPKCVLGAGLTDLSIAQIEALEAHHENQLKKLKVIKKEQRNHLARLDRLNKSI